jgi:hypothetical protein
MLWTAIGIGGIWVAVLLISVLAPDLVSGSEQEHLPVAAFTAWFWGGVGTLALLWAVATILAVTLPVFETGSDPTRVPFAALFAPAAAAMLTALAGVVSAVFQRGPGGG